MGHGRRATGRTWHIRITPSARRTHNYGGNVMFADYTLISWRWVNPRLLWVSLALLLVSGGLSAANLNIAWNASTASNVGGYIVYYGQSSRNYTASVDVGASTSYALTRLQPGVTYYFAVSVYDSTRNFESRYSNEATATLQTGLVAAYGFDESNGMYAEDASGTGNYGVFSSGSLTRITNGHFGNALKFNGTNNWVTVSNSPSLALSTGMTLEAWVYPTTWMSGTSTVVVKQQPNTGSFDEAYLLAANSSSNQPMSAIWAGSELAVDGITQIPPNQWTHLATTYDGQYLSLYVNGVLVNMMSQTGPITASTGALEIGGNSLLGGYFKGYIDEVRIYNHALTNAQIISDSKTPISLSNPLKFVAGDPNVESTLITLPAGTAQAFKITSKTPQTLNNIQVYVDASSTATRLNAAIYTNTPAGHPYALWGGGGTLTALRAGTWNSVSVAPRSLSAGTSYWIVILGTGGTLNLRGQPATGTNVTETSASTTLTSLPNSWTTGTVSTGGPVSVYGAGY